MFLGGKEKKKKQQGCRGETRRARVARKASGSLRLWLLTDYYASIQYYTLGYGLCYILHKRNVSSGCN